MRNRQRNLELQKEYYKSHRDVSFSTVTIRCSFVGNVDVNENVRTSLVGSKSEITCSMQGAYLTVVCVSVGYI